MSTIIETQDPGNDITLQFVTVPSGVKKIVITQSFGGESIVMDMETARKVSFVLRGMTDDWRRQNPSGGHIHASDD